MYPIPCAHCGVNFMRQTIDPESPRLCNNCSLREEKRNPINRELMQKTIDIKITCPISIHNNIEEYCMNKGINLSKYFIDLHQYFINQNMIQHLEIALSDSNEISDKLVKKKGTKK
jgi:hypothetical protein